MLETAGVPTTTLEDSDEYSNAELGFGLTVRVKHDGTGMWAAAFTLFNHSSRALVCTPALSRNDAAGWLEMRHDERRTCDADSAVAFGMRESKDLILVNDSPFVPHFVS